MLLGALLAGTSPAQDTNYWTQQYGTRAQLVGGVVVGSFLDLGATYYNPGALLMINTRDVVLTANAFDATRLTLQNGIAPGKVLSTTTAGPAPTLFAGLLPSKWFRGQFAYSSLTRQAMHLRAEGRTVEVRDVINPPPGDENFTGEVLYEHDLTENWFGITWADTLKGKKIGVGGTWYLVYRGHRVRAQQNADAAGSGGVGAASTLMDEFDYQHFRFVWKFGAAWNLAPLTCGLAVTTPSVGLFGQGSASYTRSLIGLDLNGDGVGESFLAADYQKDLDPTYRSPFSIAAGASYRWKKMTVHASAEWFDAVDEYDVMELRNLPETPFGIPLQDRLRQELASVFNYGVGIEHHFSGDLAAYVGFATDFSAAVPNSSAGYSFSNWDIYHFTAGSAFRIVGLDLTLGAGYSFGNSVKVAPFNFSKASKENLLLGEPTGTKISYQRLTAIIGFSFGL